MYTIRPTCTQRNTEHVQHFLLPSKFDSIRQKFVKICQNSTIFSTNIDKHSVVAFTLQDTGEVLLREQSKEMAVKFKGLTAEDVLIYELIKGSGSMGLWTRDMKTRTNLQTAQVTKILKTLEARKLVKSVRAAANGNKKVRIFRNLEILWDNFVVCVWREG